MKHETFRREEPSNGNVCTRAMTARTLASLWRKSIEEVALTLWPNDKTLHYVVTRAASNPATTFTPGWAAELVRRITADTVDALGTASGAADVLRQCLVLDWNGAGIISAPGFVASASYSGFVKEGDPIPVWSLALGPAQLSPYKLASISALTREMVESSNAEALISDCLTRSAGLALDAAFFDSNAAVPNTRPAGIRNGIAALGPSANADVFAAVAEDISSVINAVAAVGGKGPYILVAGPGRVASLNLRFVTQASADPANPSTIIPVASTAVGNDLIAIAPKAIVAALSPDPEIETANAATLVMDSAPGAAGTMGPEKNMFQAESLAVKSRWPVSWALRDPRAVAWLTPAWK
jgi:Phage capsid family